MKLSRRNLLQMFAATAASSVAARYASAAWPDPLAIWEPASQAGSYTPRKVLEIFLRGGASQWGAFWYDPILGGSRTGSPAGTGDDDISTTDWGNLITGGGAPTVHNWESRQIGRAAGPMFRLKNNGAGTPNRKLADYMRVLYVAHDLLPHEAAIPYATTGTTLGRPHQAGLGAAIWRRHDPVAPAGIRSLVLQVGGASGDDLAANYLASTGQHGVMYRPPIVKLGDTAFYDALPRTGLTSLPQEDFKKFYRNRYEARLKYSGAPSAVRSAGWTAYQASLDTMQQYHDDLYTLLTAYAADLFPNPAITVPDYHTNNLSRNAVKTAIKMLKAPGSLLKHVAVVDGGVEADYDTHKPPPAGTIAAGRVEIVQNGNIWNICDTLANNLNAILDNNIVVLIHSEFGRREETPDDGTEHHMPGYTNVVIGDVITNPGFTGEASGADGSVAAMIATAAGHPFSPIAGQPIALSPTDVHAAVAACAGIDPWQADMFEGDLDKSRTLGGDSAGILLGVS